VERERRADHHQSALAVGPHHGHRRWLLRRKRAVRLSESAGRGRCFLQNMVGMWPTIRRKSVSIHINVRLGRKLRSRRPTEEGGPKREPDTKSRIDRCTHWTALAHHNMWRNRRLLGALLRKRRRKTDTRATQGATWAPSTPNHATPAQPLARDHAMRRRAANREGSQAAHPTLLAARTAGTAARERRARSSQTQTQRCTCAAACARARARLSSRAPARSGSQRSTGAAAAMRRLGAVGRKQSELGRSFRPSAANVVLIYCIGPSGGDPSPAECGRVLAGYPAER
jgi:hypothetical protein